MNDTKYRVNPGGMIPEEIEDTPIPDAFVEAPEDCEFPIRMDDISVPVADKSMCEYTCTRMDCKTYQEKVNKKRKGKYGNTRG